MYRQPLLVAAVALGAATLAATPAVSAPPTPVGDRIELRAGDHCDFPVVLEVRGTGKLLELPGGRLTFVRARQVATVTNTETGATLSTSRNGTQHVQTLADGSTTVTFTGQNVVLQDEGVLLLVGRFTSTQGPPPDGESTPLDGGGHIVNLCEELAP